MVNKNGCENGGSRTPDKVICEQLKGIKTDQLSAKSSQEAGETTQQSKEVARGYKICCLSKAEETNKLYQDMMTYVTISNFKKTEIAQKNVDSYIKKDDDIEKLIKESSKLLNELRLALDEANSAACEIKNCLKSKGIIDKGDKPAEVNDLVDEIMEKTGRLKMEGKNAFESAVVIAGIQTFTNITALKEFTLLLMAAVKAFKDYVAANITSSSAEVAAIREELNKLIEELAQSICDKNSYWTTRTGLEQLIDFICNGECDEGCIDLCKDFEDCGKVDQPGQHDNKKKGKQTSDAY